MKLIRALIIILAIAWLGEILNKTFHIPIPGSVLGMMLMLLFLLSGVIKLPQIQEVSDFLLSHLAILFIPSGVGIMVVFYKLQGVWLILLSLTIVMTLVVMSVTALVVQWLGGKNEEHP